MARKKREISMRLIHRHTLLLDPAHHNWVEQQAKSSGFQSSQQYIRELIKRERAGLSSAMVTLEDRLVQSNHKLQAEMESTQLTAFLAFASVMGLAQTFFQSMLPPTREAKQVLDANLKARMDTFLKTVAIDMKGKWATALHTLTEEAQEDE